MPALFRRRFIAWAALFAVLFPALLPAATAARYVSDPVAFAEICRVASADPASGSGNAPASNAGHQGHCALCTGVAWQPPADRVSLPVPVARRDSTRAPEPDAVLPADFSALQPLNPRAPPRGA